MNKDYTYWINRLIQLYEDSPIRVFQVVGVIHEDCTYCDIAPKVSDCYQVSGALAP